jgi:hypothetical protein
LTDEIKKCQLCRSCVPGIGDGRIYCRLYRQHRLPDGCVEFVEGWGITYISPGDKPPDIDLSKLKADSDIVVYVAGPVSNGGVLDDEKVDANVNVAILIGKQLLEEGFFPLVPHLTHFWNQRFPASWDRWMELGLALLKRCDVLYRIEGSSKGSDMEMELARQRKIPVFTDMDSLLKWREDASTR